MSYLTDHEAVNLDDLEDWKLAEKLLKLLTLMEKIKIGFTISNSWGVKNLLNSGVIPELKSSFYISIYTTKIYVDTLNHNSQVHLIDFI